MSFRPSFASRTLRFVGSGVYLAFGMFFLEVAHRLVNRDVYLMAGLVGGFAAGVLWLGLLWLATVFHPALHRDRFVTIARVAMALVLAISYLGQVLDAIYHPGPLWKPIFLVVDFIAFPLLFHFAKRWIR